MLSLLCALVIAACGGGEPPAATSPMATVTPQEAPARATAPVAIGDGMSFEFALAADRTTSAGVYGGDGTLVRTLWRRERFAAGRWSARWDQQRDDGSRAPAGTYTVRLIHHDLRYVWEGVIGNTSGRTSGVPHRAYLPPLALAADGLHLHYAVGYNEGQSGIHGLEVTQPSRPARPIRHVDPFVGIPLLASDGERLYAANTGGMDKGSFVFAYEMASARPWRFEAGAEACLARMQDGVNCYGPQHYPSVILRRAAGEALPSGIAVQRNGRVLAVAYGAEGLVRLFDKRTGRPIGQVVAPLSPHSQQQLAMSAGGDLWILTADAAWRFTDLEASPRVTQRLQGLSRPLAAVGDPGDDGALWVAEGGGAQQVRRFGADGLPSAALGRRGGMGDNARVADDRLCFAFDAGREHTALAVDGQGHVWVVDTCNNRMARFHPGGARVDGVMYLPHSYVSAVDSGNPRRVFANLLEFEVDPALDPAAPGAWRLVRNWWPALPQALRDVETMNMGWGGFRSVHTLANGRTYAWLMVRGSGVVVELRGDGTVGEVMRPAPPKGPATAPVLHPDGAIVWGQDEGEMQQVIRIDLVGFDAGGQPRWSAGPRVWAAAPRRATAPYHRMGTWTGSGPARWPVTTSGRVIFFNGDVRSVDAFHLGAVPIGGSEWAWQASPSGPLDGRGSFQTRRHDPKIEYGGNVAMALDRHVVYGYHGEFYTDLGSGRIGQANQFMHFHDSGLLVGQFGTPNLQGGPEVAEPGRSGNAFSPSLVRSGANVHLYHNDESHWGGVHRWRLMGADDIVELSATGTAGSALTLR